ncbi:MAG: hypothetical protein KTQ49_08565, partial [Candidatus Omnitrophica bacterium]|nr:hypothetical protein [Candidatus Omnitrophota bacterium]
MEDGEKVQNEGTAAIDLTKPVYGRIIGIRGPVVDVRFEQVNDLPALYDVLIGQTFDRKKVVMEVAEHLSKFDVRCISLSETLNL